MNCIEADNEIHLVPERLYILEEKVEILEKLVFKPIYSEIEKISCPKCHPTFDDNGIL